MRPLLAELDSGGDIDLLGLPGTPAEEVVQPMDDETLSVTVPNQSGGLKTKMFEYERVYNPTDTQAQVFDDVAPLLTSLLDG